MPHKPRTEVVATEAPLLFGIPEAAWLLNMSEKTLRRKVTAREVPHRRPNGPNSRIVRFTQADIDEIIAASLGCRAAHDGATATWTAEKRMNQPYDELLTPQEIREIWGVTSKTVVRWAREGKLGPEVRTLGGHRRFKREYIERLLAGEQP